MLPAARDPNFQTEDVSILKQHVVWKCVVYEDEHDSDFFIMMKLVVFQMKRVSFFKYIY